MTLEFNAGQDEALDYARGLLAERIADRGVGSASARADLRRHADALAELVETLGRMFDAIEAFREDGEGDAP